MYQKGASTRSCSICGIDLCQGTQPKLTLKYPARGSLFASTDGPVSIRQPSSWKPTIRIDFHIMCLVFLAQRPPTEQRDQLLSPTPSVGHYAQLKVAQMFALHRPTRMISQVQSLNDCYVENRFWPVKSLDKGFPLGYHPTRPGVSIRNMLVGLEELNEFG